jgi:hypothetical protein
MYAAEDEARAAWEYAAEIDGHRPADP